MFNVWRSFHRNGNRKVQHARAQAEDAQPNEAIDKRVQRPPAVQTTVPPRRVNSYGQRGSRGSRGRGEYMSQDANRRHESVRASSGSSYVLPTRPSGSFPTRSSQIGVGSEQPLSPGAPPSTSTQSLSFVPSPICRPPKSLQFNVMAGAGISVEKSDTETEIVSRTSTSGHLVKDERSPSPDLASQPRPVTSGSRLYSPVPPECQKSRPGSKACREAWAKREADKLRDLGLKVVRQFIREDGMVIDWESMHPVMSDTLMPDPHNLGAVIQLVHGHNRVASEGRISKKRKLRPTSQSPSLNLGTSLAEPICIDEAPSTVEISQSSAAKSSPLTSLDSLDGEEAGPANSSRHASLQQAFPGQRADSGSSLHSGGLTGFARTPSPASASNHATPSLAPAEVQTLPRSSQKPSASHSPDSTLTRSPVRAVSMLNERMKRRRLSNVQSDTILGQSSGIGASCTSGPTSPPSVNRDERARPRSSLRENRITAHSPEGSAHEAVADHLNKDPGPGHSPAAEVSKISDPASNDQAIAEDYPTEDEADELSAAALEYMQQYIEAFDSDCSSLASAFSRNATFSCRLQHVHKRADSTDHRVQQGRLDIVSALLSLSNMKFCPEGPIDLQYDVAPLANHIGVLCAAQGTLHSAGPAMPFTLSFVLRRKNHDTEDESTDALWPLIAVAHQMIVWNVP